MRAARPGVALAATLAIQIFVSLVATATAVLAPEIAQTFGIVPKWVGVFIGLVYAGAMLASLACGGFIERFGAIRVSQGAVALCAIGALVIGVAPGHAVALLIVAALVIGVGYGPITPASSHVLIRTAPPDKLALTFSIKQTGVPAGAALAGAALPALALTLGWRTAFAVVAGAGVVVAVAAEIVRRSLDTDLKPDRALTPAGALAPLRLVWRSRALTELAAISFFYAATQVCLTTFVVVYLTEALQWSLVAAGLALTVTTLGGVAGRVIWGFVADRLLPPRRVLALLGIVGCGCSLTLATADTAWPAAGLLCLTALFGASAIGWNGVQLAEVARHAPRGSAGAITGATGFITFSGVVAGPPLFAVLAGATGSYRAGFVVMGLASGACGLVLLVRKTPRGR